MSPTDPADVIVVGAGAAGLMTAIVAVAWLHWLILAVGLRRSYGISMLGTSPVWGKRSFAAESVEPKTT